MHSSDARLKRASIGPPPGSDETPHSGHERDTNGHFADRKSELSNSAKNIIRSFGDLERSCYCDQLCRRTSVMPGNLTNRRIAQRPPLFRYASAECKNCAEPVRSIIRKPYMNSTLHLSTCCWNAGFLGSYRCEEGRKASPPLSQMRNTKGLPLDNSA
jgi:hypothetical protein